MDHITTHAAYLRDAVDSPERIIALATKHLESVKFDTMVGQGLSGALVIPILARAMSKHWMIVRKDNDGTHSCEKCEGTLGKKWVFVDDLISSGQTRTRVKDHVASTAARHKFETTYVGDFLYYNYGTPRFDPAEASPDPYTASAFYDPLTTAYFSRL